MGVEIRLSGVTVRREGRALLDDVTVDIPAGRVTALAGPNGAGKTTLIACLLGQIAYEGAIAFERPDGCGCRPRIGYVPQRFAFDRGLPLTVLELLAAGLSRRPLWLGVGRAVRERAVEALRSVGAEGLLRNRLGTLSGGELQRVLLANALLRDPELLILDEPGAGVDSGGEKLFCERLEELRAARGFTQLMVSHNLALMVVHAERVVLLNRNVLAEGSPCEVLAPARLEAAYGMHMLRAGDADLHRATCPHHPAPPTPRPACGCDAKR